MKLDRALIKSQAKALIKGNVFKFFIIIFVVTLLAEGGTIYSSSTSVVNQMNDGFENAFSQKDDNYGLNNADEYDFDDFGNYENNDNMEEFNLDDFTKQFENEVEEQQSEKAVTKTVFSGALGAIASLMSIATLFLAPLLITLAGVFYLLIKGNNLGWSEEFNYVFTKTFDKNYWNKFLLSLLKGIFSTLLFCLFIIPGVIFYYKYYFTSFIMAEKPELSWKEAMNISKKMTEGHKGELFVLDLSFLGWDLLVGITCGIVGIYVLPYVYTTQALYYENFKLRAFQLGVMSEADYLTENEKAAMVYGADAQAPQQNYYQPQPIQAPVQENTYHPPVQENTYPSHVQEDVPPQEQPEEVSAPIEEAQPVEGNDSDEE